jgi:acyl-CoA dehydrogenase
VRPAALLEDLKALAREEGLWNLFLPGLRDDEPGTRLSHLNMRRWPNPWAACPGRPRCSTAARRHRQHGAAAPFASPEQRQQWLEPLLQGHIRSAFAMSEPDVASSDPTNLQTTVRREGDTLVVQGRKWFITGAAHPHCRLLIVLCRNADDEGSGEPMPDSHHQHSMVLVPLDAPGVQVLRNISVLHHHTPEGHCEILLHQCAASHLLGDWGAGFAMAQARLDRGACTTACAALASASWPCSGGRARLERAPLANT